MSVLTNFSLEDLIDLANQRELFVPDQVLNADELDWQTFLSLTGNKWLKFLGSDLSNGYINQIIIDFVNFLHEDVLELIMKKGKVNQQNNGREL